MNSVTCRTNLPVMLIKISFSALTSSLTQCKVTLFKVWDNFIVDPLPFKFIVSAGRQNNRSAGVILRGECKAVHRGPATKHANPEYTSDPQNGYQ